MDLKKTDDASNHPAPTSNGDTENAPKDPQAVKYFTSLLRACSDPIDRENLRSYRDSTKDFQAAINKFAMEKALEANERFDTAEKNRERQMQIVADEKEDAGRAGEEERKESLRRLKEFTVGNDLGGIAGGPLNQDLLE